MSLRKKRHVIFQSICYGYIDFLSSLDLVISSNTISHQIIECYVEPRLHTSSDHETLLTCLEVQGAEAKKPTVVKFRLEKMDEKQFCTSLEAQKDLVRTSLRQAEAALLRIENGREALDQFAQKATAAIHSSLELSTEKTKSSEKGEAWCRWVASFLNDRTAALRPDGQTGGQEAVKIGVPQGSPVAPILLSRIQVDPG